jgi:hypothetical protein
MQDRLGTQLFRVGNRGGKRLAVVVTVGNDADFQVSPPFVL